MKSKKRPNTKESAEHEASRQQLAVARSYLGELEAAAQEAKAEFKRSRKAYRQAKKAAKQARKAAKALAREIKARQAERPQRVRRAKPAARAGAGKKDMSRVPVSAAREGADASVTPADSAAGSRPAAG